MDGNDEFQCYYKFTRQLVKLMRFYWLTAYALNGNSFIRHLKKSVKWFFHFKTFSVLDEGSNENYVKLDFFSLIIQKKNQHLKIILRLKNFQKFLEFHFIRMSFGA